MLYNIRMDQFVALADPTRRQIIELLAEHGELSASDISSGFAMSAPAISQHLKALREAKLVLMEKRAQQRIYRLNPDAMLELEVWIHRLTLRWNERFAALDAVLEELQAGEINDQQHCDEEWDQESNQDHCRARHAGDHHHSRVRRPRELVFRAYTEADLYVRWVGPAGMR